jgi:hypothetical protein
LAASAAIVPFRLLQQFFLSDSLAVLSYNLLFFPIHRLSFFPSSSFRKPLNGFRRQIRAKRSLRLTFPTSIDASGTRKIVPRRFTPVRDLYCPANSHFAAGPQNLSRLLQHRILHFCVRLTNSSMIRFPVCRRLCRLRKQAVVIKSMNATGPSAPENIPTDPTDYILEFPEFRK